MGVECGNEVRNFLTIRETARTGLISESCLRRMVAAGNCPGFYAGTRFMVNYSLLLDQLASASGDHRDVTK